MAVHAAVHPLTTILPLMRPSCVAACSAFRLLPPPETNTASLAGKRPLLIVSGGLTADVAAGDTAEAAADAAVGPTEALAAVEASDVASTAHMLRMWCAGRLLAAGSRQLPAPAAAAPRRRCICRDLQGSSCAHGVCVPALYDARDIGRRQSASPAGMWPPGRQW